MIDFADPCPWFKNILEAFVFAIADKQVMRSREDMIKSIALMELPK
jgi:hypothetical protein